MQLNLMCIALAVLLALLQCGKAYPIPLVTTNSTVGNVNTKNATNATMPATAKFNFTDALNSSDSSIFRTQARAYNASQQSAVFATLHASTASKPVLQHLKRKKRETRASMPYSFHIMHLPCDFEMRGVFRYIPFMQNHCIWAFNNRFQNEGFYRVFKLYELEAFFFGQYHERLKRFEVDPHSWDYREDITD